MGSEHQAALLAPTWYRISIFIGRQNVGRRTRSRAAAGCGIGGTESVAAGAVCPSGQKCAPARQAAKSRNWRRMRGIGRDCLPQARCIDLGRTEAISSISAKRPLCRRRGCGCSRRSDRRMSRWQYISVVTSISMYWRREGCRLLLQLRNWPSYAPRNQQKRHVEMSAAE